MTNRRRLRDHVQNADLAIDRLRQGDGTQSTVTAYKPLGGRPKAVPGDERFPFFKDVSDILEPVRYLEPVELDGNNVVQNPLPVIADQSDFLNGPVVDVAGYRLVTFYLQYFADNGSLIVVPEARIDLPEASASNNVSTEFFPIGVIDPSLTVVSPPVILPCGGSRHMYATELRMDGLGMPTTDPCKLSVVFDVAPYLDFRLRVGVTAGTAGLNAFHTLQR